MLPILIDENLDQRILRGLRLRLPQLDFLVVQQAGLAGCDDPTLLDFAADNSRVLLTHDVNTAPKHAAERLAQGLPMAGVIVVPDRLEIGRAIDDLAVIIECITAADADHQIQYLPLK